MTYECFWLSAKFCFINVMVLWKKSNKPLHGLWVVFALCKILFYQLDGFGEEMSVFICNLRTPTSPNAQLYGWLWVAMGEIWTHAYLDTSYIPWTPYSTIHLSSTYMVPKNQVVSSSFSFILSFPGGRLVQWSSNLPQTQNQQIRFFYSNGTRIKIFWHSKPQGAI